MANNSIVIPAARDQVFAVLEDPFAYSEWVVGPKRIVRADRSFPAEGSEFTHEEAVGPVETHGETEVLEIEPPQHVKLRANLRPFGAIVHIDIELEDADGGTRVTMSEKPVEGPVAMLWNPVFDSLMWLRNTVALRRLRRLVLKRRSLR
jgi:uncharacterized protein YndB with AHSA1/START domain